MIFSVNLHMECFSKEYPSILKQILTQGHFPLLLSKSFWKDVQVALSCEKNAVSITCRFFDRKEVVAAAIIKDQAIRLTCSCGYEMEGSKLCPHLLFILEECRRRSLAIERLYLEQKRIQQFEAGYRTYLGKKETLNQLLSFFEPEKPGLEAPMDKIEAADYALILHPRENGLFAKVALRQKGTQGKLVKTGQKLIGFQRMYKKDHPFFLRALSCLDYIPINLNPFHDETTYEVTNFQKFVETFRSDAHVYWDAKNLPVTFGPPLTLHLRLVASLSSAHPKQLLDLRLINEENQIDHSLEETRIQVFRGSFYAYYGKNGETAAIIGNTVYPVSSPIDAETALRLRPLLNKIDWSREKQEIKESLRSQLFFPLLAYQVSIAPELLGQAVSYSAEKPKALWKIQSYHWNYRFQLFFIYGEHRLSVASPESFILSEKTGELFRRDLDYERKHSRIVRSLLDREACFDQESLLYDLHLESVLRLINEVFPQYETEVILECDERLFSRGEIRPLVKTRFTFTADWLDLELNGEWNGQPIATEDLDRLLANGSRYIQINGEYFSIDRKELEKLEKLRIRLGRLKERQRFPKADFEMVQTIRETTEASFDEKTERFLSRVDRFTQIQDYELPPDFGGYLRPYQIAGYNWLRFLEEYRLSGVLADDMGLGKTVQTLALLLDFKRRYGRLFALIVAPKSLLSNWDMETKRFAPGLSTLIYHGYGRQKNNDVETAADIVFTTYATLRNDSHRFIHETFDYIIIDEAQNIKNKSTQTFKELLKIRAANRLALSGTPIENGLSDLKAIFDFLMPGFLGSDRAFFSTYDEHTEELARKIAPLVLRRKKEDVLSELPEKSIENVYVDMTKNQTALYEKYFQAARGEALAVMNDPSRFQRNRLEILTILLRLRQICCHPHLVVDDLTGEELSGKLELLKELIRDICSENHKVLVFSQFSKMLEIIKNELHDYGNKLLMMTGKTQNRQEIVNTFKNNAETQIFLMTLKVGGVGLNLTEADYVIIFDPWWNPASEAQAIDRTHRIGQTKPVFVYRLIAKNSIEEKVLELQKRKQSVADGVLRSSERNAGNLGKEELTYLFS
ncbi:MAG: DEAD/DEAH box helicase [Thermotogaceae bacterium]|nr:DEAD/DEAH box helicase [Thermotogaceae bacterium]